jgi:predicted Rossmann fold nucleotide-binding protein DprA/Smf involved in DNA uptake
MFMKKLESELKAVSKSLAALTQKVEKLVQQATQAQPAQKAPAKKTRAVAAGGKTVLDSVYDVIKRTKKGVTVAQLKQKTSLDGRQLSNALYKLSKKGQVYAKSRGLYAKK